ncbi:MAG: adenylate/guanylate cyclase domain-containing protein, partial [Gammaproteobacteria bacterium]|nr:adenylate/guanylate cyclase domain-containing protein [Gammaproteobacteria bacterium]
TQPEQDKVRDDYHTVFSNVDGLYVSGVELAATAFANLLDNRSIKPSSNSESLLALFLLGFVAGVVFLDLRLSVWQAIFWGLIPIFIYIGFTHYQFGATGAWQPWIIPIVQTLCALFGALFLRYLVAKREWQQLEAAFGLFLPARVVDDIIKNAGIVKTSDSQLVQGVCLATDAESYVGLGASMDPRSLGEFMNAYYEVLFAPVRKHQGIISDVVGDAMLALWTAPSLDIALRQQACLAGLDMAEAIECFNQASDHPHLPTRIGLHFGEMLLGNVGTIQHFEYRAVGDVVNTTNRIQSVNKYLGTRLLVSSEVVEGLDEFLIRPLGGFLLVGRPASVDLAELIICKRDANAQQLRLCEAFSSALQAYQSQQWQTSCDEFKQILKEYPNDGPAHFFLKRCQSLIDIPPSDHDHWDSAIKMDLK